MELNYILSFIQLKEKSFKRSFAKHIGSIYEAKTVRPFGAHAVQKSRCASKSLCRLVGYGTLHLGHSRKLSSRQLDCFRGGLLSYVVSFLSNTACKSSCDSVCPDSWSFCKRRSFTVRLGHACTDQMLQENILRLDGTQALGVLQH